MERKPSERGIRLARFCLRGCDDSEAINNLAIQFDEAREIRENSRAGVDWNLIRSKKNV